MKRNKSPGPRRLLGAGVLLALATVSLVAAAKLGKTGNAGTTFKAAGPAGLTIEGVTTDMVITDDGTTLTISVPLANLKTGIDLRDKHTKNAIEADKYPTTTLTVARAALTFPAAGAESSGDAHGQLALHGQTRDVTFHYSARQSGDTISVKASTRINVDDFGVKRPSYLGVTVKPDVDIITAFDARDN
jgi:polyisoprenoid-binding protein YceI